MIHLLSFNWHELLQPQFYIQNGGLWLLLFVIFAETGLFAGFFLPGDSLLFVAGIYAQNMDDGSPGLSHSFLSLIGLGSVSNEWLDLVVLILLVSIAGILGNLLGYWFGKKSGPFLFERKDTFFFKKKYLHQANDFYTQYGGWAVVAARFVPIIRTFAPIVAGIVQMDKKKFNNFNIVGCIAWVTSMILAGHFLQKWILKQFHFDLKDHLEIIVVAIVLVSTVPIIWKLFISKAKPKPKSI
ncbi:DedA family protein [soil metagenome]